MTFWSGTRVLVTGAHGFSGSHLCRALLEEDAAVRAFVRNGGNLENIADIEEKMEIVQGDVNQSNLDDALKGIDYVFHLAAVTTVLEARDSPQNTFSVNAIGTYNVATAALRAGVKAMLHVSTPHVYGNQSSSSLPMREDTPYGPLDVYNTSKICAEVVIRPLIDEGLPLIISRAFGKYGPGQRPEFFVSKVISHLLSGERLVLGNPKPTRDLTFVTDVARGYLLALEKGKVGETYQFSTGREIAMGDLCAMLMEMIGGEVIPEWNPSIRAHDIFRQVGDSTKAKRELGWAPRVSLEEGLARSVEWWRGKLARIPTSY